MSVAQPPRLALALLTLSIPAVERDEVLGDLAELYNARIDAHGRYPRLWFWMQAGLFLLSFLSSFRRRPADRPPWRPMMERLFSVRNALQPFRQDPGYAIAFIVTLGLGIGATTAIFSAVEGVLIRPLPYPHADRIMLMQQARPPQTNESFSFVEIADYRTQSRVVDEFVEYGDWQFNVVGLQEPQLVNGGLVTANYFKVLAIRPLMGRTLLSQDDAKSASPVAVLTYEYWRAAGQDPSIVGKTIELSGIPATVVGVLEPGSHYAGTGRAALYANYPTNRHYMGASMQNQRGHRMTTVYALLKPGVPLETAQAEVSTIANGLHATYPADYPWRTFSVMLTPWRDVLVRKARPMLLTLMGAVALVLLVACANVGNLTLARQVRREKELAVRAALGASPGRLRGQLLAEHLVLALAGSALGIGVAATVLQLLIDYTARLTLRADAVSLNGVVLGFSFVIGLGSAVLVAWVPRLPSADGSTLTGTTVAARSTLGQRQRTAQRVLVVIQVAVSFVVLVGAGLLVRTFANLAGISAGFDSTNVLSLRAPNLSLPPARDRELFERVSEQMRTYPGVVSVSTASRVPFEASQVFPIPLKADGSRFDGTTAPVQMFALTVSPDYFSTLKIPVRRGRTFGVADTATNAHPAVINETMAQLVFTDANPLDRAIDWNDGMRWVAPHTIIGVVGDVHEIGGSDTVLPTLYESTMQAAPGPDILIRTTGDPALVALEATKLIHGLDPKRAVIDVRTLESAAADRIAPSRVTATLFSGFALLALSIAAVGIGAVLAFSVTQRTREFGIRMALGSGRGPILSGVLREGLVLAGAGLVMGAVAAGLLARFLQRMLFEVPTLDPATFVGTALLLAAVAAAAAWVPALRATRVDPNVALRCN